MSQLSASANAAIIGKSSEWQHPGRSQSETPGIQGRAKQQHHAVRKSFGVGGNRMQAGSGVNRTAIMRLSAFAGLCLTVLAGQFPDSARRGYALFHGQEALAGKIRGHDEGLPPEAVRCSNCHEATGRLTGVAAPARRPLASARVQAAPGRPALPLRCGVVL